MRRQRFSVTPPSYDHHNNACSVILIFLFVLMCNGFAITLSRVQVCTLLICYFNFLILNDRLSLNVCVLPSNMTPPETFRGINFSVLT